MNRISFFGLGYAGLTTAVCFAHKGVDIICFDTDENILKSINEGNLHFYEPDLGNLLFKTVKDGSLKCTPNPEEAILESETTFITVGTPSKPDGGIDLTQIEEASKMIGQVLSKKNSWHLIVVKSTVTPGTTEDAVKPILEGYSNKSVGLNLGLCVNPEFLQEGQAIKGTLNPDRIIIGEFDERSGDILEKLYKSFHGENMPPLMRTTPVNAEMIKYANNAFLAMKISFINMIANLCEKLSGTDVKDVAEGIGLDRRIGRAFLDAGVGWGGSCLKKDLNALRVCVEQMSGHLPLVDVTLKINEEQPLRVVKLAEELLGSLKTKRIAVLGLAFKPDTDDMREAVSIKAVNKLLEEEANVIAYDPAAAENAYKIFGERILYGSSPQECLKNADCAIILTEWSEFKKIEPKVFTSLMKTPAIIDGRRIFDPKEFREEARFKAIGLGN